MRTGFEVIKVVEMQHLREVRDAAGHAVVDMTMTSEPAIYVPFWGSDVKMGEVVFRVRSEPQWLHGAAPPSALPASFAESSRSAFAAMSRGMPCPEC